MRNCLKNSGDVVMVIYGSSIDNVYMLQAFPNHDLKEIVVFAISGK